MGISFQRSALPCSSSTTVKRHFRSVALHRLVIEYERDLPLSR